MLRDLSRVSSVRTPSPPSRRKSTMSFAPASEMKEAYRPTCTTRGFTRSTSVRARVPRSPICWLRRSTVCTHDSGSPSTRASIWQPVAPKSQPWPSKCVQCSNMAQGAFSRNTKSQKAYISMSPNLIWPDPPFQRSGLSSARRSRMKVSTPGHGATCSSLHTRRYRSIRLLVDASNAMLTTPPPLLGGKGDGNRTGSGSSLDDGSLPHRAHTAAPALSADIVRACRRRHSAAAERGRRHPTSSGLFFCERPLSQPQCVDRHP